VGPEALPYWRMRRRPEGLPCLVGEWLHRAPRGANRGGVGPAPSRLREGCGSSSGRAALAARRAAGLRAGLPCRSREPWVLWIRVKLFVWQVAACRLLLQCVREVGVQPCCSGACNNMCGRCNVSK
jgi:hypothetical protein